jgi:hypothetical protein
MRNGKFLLFFLFLSIVSCSKNEVDSFDPDDWDADGVSNEKEYFDNTNPNDPCSFHSESQYPPSIPESWKQLDCDGDGVTNGQELIDLTAVLFSCEFKIESLQIDLTSDEWRNSDCDGDGVTNYQEITDDTSLFDNCSFIPSSISIESSESWLDLDCDEDGRTNRTEIENNTNPTDKNDFIGKGDKIVEIINANRHRHIFTENGTRLDQIINMDNKVLTDFKYVNNNLEEVIINSEEGTIITTFKYSNNKIHQIIKKQETEEETLDVVYEGNSIFVYSGLLPDDLFDGKYDFNENDKLINEEHYYETTSSNTFIYSKETFSYNSNGDVINSIGNSNQYYYDTQRTGTNPYSYGYNYGYIDNIKNPMAIPLLKIYKNYVLINDILSQSFYIRHGVFSSEFLSYMSRNSPPTSHTFSYGVKSTQQNQLPTLGYESGFWGSNDISYYYKE